MSLEDYNLKEKEKKQIDEILAKAKKRPRKKTYSKKFVYQYMDEGFKEFSYNNFDDVIDMIESLFEIGEMVGVANGRLKGDVIYHLMEEGFLEMIEKSNEKQVTRLNRLMAKWNLGTKSIRKINKEIFGEDFNHSPAKRWRI